MRGRLARHNKVKRASPHTTHTCAPLGCQPCSLHVLSPLDQHSTLPPPSHLPLFQVKVLYRSTISLKDVKNLVNRIALLPAVPPSVLLSLLDDPAGAAALAGASDGGAGAAPPALPETVQTLVKDSVMTALVRLDDSEQVRCTCM